MCLEVECGINKINEIKQIAKSTKTSHTPRWDYYDCRIFLASGKNFATLRRFANMSRSFIFPWNIFQHDFQLERIFNFPLWISHIVQFETHILQYLRQHETAHRVFCCSLQWQIEDVRKPSMQIIFQKRESNENFPPFSRCRLQYFHLSHQQWNIICRKSWRDLNRIVPW